MNETRYYLFSIFIFLLANLSLAQIKLPSDVITMLATRDMRIHHYLWHLVRNLWEGLDDYTKGQIRSLGWEPSHPSMDQNGNIYYDNLSGEDFLYMHNQMIKHVNGQLAACNYSYGKSVVGWKDIPAPNDAEYPVPPSFDSSDASFKTDDYYYNFLKLQNDKYKNPIELQKLTLSQLGAYLEFEVHNPLHVRFSSAPTYGVRPDPVIFYNTNEIDTYWDDPSYDWMSDFYSSHVNSVFWKLHGWVDDRIEDWKQANKIVGEIQWKGTWVGPPMTHKMIMCNNDAMVMTDNQMPMFNEISHEYINNKEEVFRILNKLNEDKKFSLIQEKQSLNRKMKKFI